MRDTVCNLCAGILFYGVFQSHIKIDWECSRQMEWNTMPGFRIFILILSPHLISIS